MDNEITQVVIGDNKIVFQDGLSVLIDSETDNIQCGHIVTDHGNEPYYIATLGDISAGGKTERGAQLALQKKIFASKTEDERIEEFVAQYAIDDVHTVDEWIKTHHQLMGSCGMGAYRFIRDKGIKRYAKLTTKEFLDVVDGAYGGDIVAKIKERYK